MNKLTVFNKNLIDCEYFIVFRTERFGYKFGSGVNLHDRSRQIHIKDMYPGFYYSLRVNDYLASMHKNLSTLIPNDLNSPHITVYKLYLNSGYIEQYAQLNSVEEVQQWKKEHN